MVTDYSRAGLELLSRWRQSNPEKEAERVQKERDAKAKAEFKNSEMLGQGAIAALVTLATAGIGAAVAAPAAGAGAVSAGATGATGAATGAGTAAPSLIGNIGAGLGRAGAAMVSPSNLAQAAMAGKAGYSPTPGAGLIAGLEPAAKDYLAKERLAGVMGNLPAGVEPSKISLGPEGEISREFARPATAPQYFMGGAMPGVTGGQQPPQPAVGQYQVGETATDDATGEKFKWDGSQWVNVLTGQPQ